MWQHMIHGLPFFGAFSGAFGLLAQVTLPEDFGNWPVTAMLSLLVIFCLIIISKQSKANSDASIAVATSLTALMEKQGNSSESIDRLAAAITTLSDRDARLCVIMENRPCIAPHQHPHMQQPRHIP